MAGGVAGGRAAVVAGGGVGAGAGVAGGGATETITANSKRPS